MKINQLTFTAIRNFKSTVIFDFSNTGRINTVSGKNGSGKTTIFKCILLCQKAFFQRQLLDKPTVKENIKSELAKYFVGKESSIEINFSFNNEGDKQAGFKLFCQHFDKNHIEYSLEFLTEHSEKFIKEYWNILDPQDIIFYIDSNKHFDEENVSHSNISISTSDTYNQLIIDTILSPEKIFSNIYQRLVRDYIRERLVPAKPRRELYFIPTKILLKELLPEIELSNFSAQHFRNQFVLLGKSTSNNKIAYFDIRNFSSGEKTLFYILLFINYVQKIGMLIIDEPENHFHENLLVKFVKILDEISNLDNYADYIIAKDRKLATESGKLSEAKEIRKQYNDYYLSQVFLVTHSKNLIYNNFGNDTNFYVDNALLSININEIEQTLREIGVSSIYSKVLFVEGSSDNEFLELFFNEYNIKVHSLSGCGQVIETYKKILPIKKYLRDTFFCFLIDKDTRNSKDITAIRVDNPTYFDEHFHILDRHEFENYLLDPRIFKEIIESHHSIFAGIETITVEAVDKEIFNIATSNKPEVIKKAIKKMNENSVTKLKENFIKKDLDISSLRAYENYFDDKIRTVDPNSCLKEMFVDNYNVCSELYNDKIWNKSWRNLCDGKAVLGQTIGHFAKHIKIDHNRLKQELKNIVNQKRDFDVNILISKLLSMFPRN